MSAIKSIGLVLKENTAAVASVVEELSGWCKATGVNLVWEERSASLMSSSEQALALSKLGKAVQAIVVLGGDGTLLGVARATLLNSPPLIGVNFGTLGFLTEIRPDEVVSTLERLVSDSARIVQRPLLSVLCLREGKQVFASEAVNDIVVQKSTSSRLMDLDVYIDDQELMSIRGDGLIFATPAGSTAYSLAAGGSIVYPQLDLTLITPICPHSLTNRPIIVPGASNLSVFLPDYDGTAFVTADGQEAFQLQSGDQIKIARSKHEIKLVKSISHDYFSRLRSKLNWGIPNKGE